MTETFERTYRYRPNRFDPTMLMEMDGIEFLRRILMGEIPEPAIGATLDFHLHEVDPGRVVFKGTPGDHVMNPIGSVHGGFAATLLDSCMACAIQTEVRKGFGYTTAELSVNYVRALSSTTGSVFAEGKVIRVGRLIGTAEGRLTDSEGRLYAHGTTTCVIYPIPAEDNSG